MSFLKNIFNKREDPIHNYQDFWNWFSTNEKVFFNAVKKGSNIEKDFFDKLSRKLNELKDDIYFVAGMVDEKTAELVLTPDGIVKNIVFIEELVQVAPAISNWKFTALKPALDIENVAIHMADYVFDSNNLFFYSNDLKDYPDEIDIVVVHSGYKEEDKATITNGTYIFLDNFLGEYNSITTIDNLVVTGKEESEKELVPIAKLKDFLIWREKEFQEKYEGMRYNTDHDSYSSLEAELNNGRPLVAIVNATLLEWDSKASHPWILKVKIVYDGQNNNGMPDNETYEKMNNFEEQITDDLKDFDGYLNIGRQTADNQREIYFACKEFRKPSKLLYNLIIHNSHGLKIDYTIYKDKYWQTFERFKPD
jgi:hypothetical protein